MKHADQTQFFKTAAELNISEAVHTALLEVHRQMLSGEINEVNFSYDYWPTVAEWNEVTGNCGCIGAHCDRLNPRLRLLDYEEDGRLGKSLGLLFFRGRYYLGRAPTLAESLTALERYLTTGDPQWATP